MYNETSQELNFFSIHSTSKGAFASGLSLQFAFYLYTQRCQGSGNLKTIMLLTKDTVD